MIATRQPIMKTAYSYVTLRYVHDVVTGEFANVGVVLYAPEQRFLTAQFTTSFERLNAMFMQVDDLHLRALMRHLDSRVKEVAKEFLAPDERAAVTDLLTIARNILPSDDSSLQWSELGGGFTADPGTTVRELFNRMVARYAPGIPREEPSAA